MSLGNGSFVTRGGRIILLKADGAERTARLTTGASEIHHLERVYQSQTRGLTGGFSSRGEEGLACVPPLREPIRDGFSGRRLCWG